jgi:hypothetical protein
VLAVGQDHGTDRVLVEVQRQTQRAVLELEQLVHRGVGQTRHPGDAVADLEDAPDLLGLDLGVEVGQVLLERCGDVAGVDGEFSHVFSVPCGMARRW